MRTKLDIYVFMHTQPFYKYSQACLKGHLYLQITVFKGQSHILIIE